MANPYQDGLDDFDRQLLGHTPLPPEPYIVSNRRGTYTFFPTPALSNASTPFNGYDTHCEPVIPPNPHLRHELSRRPGFSEDINHARSRDALIHELADPFDEGHAITTQRGRPLRSDPFVGNYERYSQISRPGPSRLQAPEHSSPTARVSSRKQRGPVSSHLASPSAQPTPTQDQSHAASSTPVVHGIPLVSLRNALPDKFRTIFPYELLNAVQSKCFDVVFNSNDNVVVAAPTGSGKTAILELAICKLALERGNENFKIVYQAPTKALCSEKARDWEKKFAHMNLKCAELTGDTSQAEMRRVGDASIIVTTPEKWDSITRKWQDHRRLLQIVELFLIDEVHILKDMRGATLEAVVSRMKTIGASVRFIALSATVPNSDDIARWLGRNHTNQHLPAHREAFGEEFRPVKLQRFVYGFESKSNDFIFDKFLDQKLPGLIVRHTQQKPILVFCFTRKSCETTAAMLADFASGRPGGGRLWLVPSQRVPVINRDLQELVRFGVAFHHAGLEAQDRTAIEQHFLSGQLGVICCTSTLAVGINLPCHTVIMKGTVGFTEDKLEEYSDLEVMQMLGRAGRPQFDDTATAIILTRAANKDRYQKMVSGQETLESRLHLNLIEHLNSEICLGTIRDRSSARTWLGGTFLSVRLRRNPGYYQLAGRGASSNQADDILEEICERDITQLQQAELVTNEDSFQCTEYGRAMSKYMVEFDTMKLLLHIPRAVGMETLITILSQAAEFKDFRFKPAERAVFREINQSPLIMYPIKETVSQTRHKVSLMVQAHLGSVQYPSSGDAAKVRRQLMMERKLVFERLNRLVRAVIDCKGHERDSVGTKTALELARALAAESWEGRPTQLTQIPNIGPVGMRKLASKDIRTVLQLADKNYDEMERLMSRQPPFGKHLQAQLDKFPRLSVEAAVMGHRVHSSENAVSVDVKATLRYLNDKGQPNWLNRAPALTFLAETSSGTLVYFWRGSMKKLDRNDGFALRFQVELRDPKDHIVCHFTCEEIVGTIVSTTLEHRLPVSIFPQRIAVRPKPSQKPGVSNQVYIDDEDLDDADLILAAEQAVARSTQVSGAAESGTSRYAPAEEPVDTGSMDEEEVETFDDPAGLLDELGPAETREPVRLPNGRWQCNHVCSGGAPTRSGKPCNHRCCKEGLDKPRKPPPRKPKRKRESDKTADVEPLSAAGQHQGVTQITTSSKRQKTQSKLPLVSVTSASTSQPTETQPTKVSKSTWEPAHFDDSELDCIDLSFTDDDDEAFLKALGGGRPVMSKTNGLSGNANVSRQSDHGHSQETPATKLDNSSQGPAPAAVKLRTGRLEEGVYEDNFLDDAGFALLEATSVCTRETARCSATDAFRTGASDDILYEGIGKKLTDAGAGERGDDLGQPLLADNVAVSSADTPSSGLEATTPATSTKPESSGGSGAADGGAKETAVNDTEPAWVAEFDQEFVDMFRGYVTFV